MRVGQPLLRLPIRFCEATLAAEVAALGEQAWLPHPQAFPGNHGIPLISPRGAVSNALAGPMAPTEHLARCPYIREIMGALCETVGRSRLMALEPGAEVPMHVDVNYYWRTHLRIHVPVVTNPGVEFAGGEMRVRMAPGEAWLLDSFYRHEVHNRGSERRVHLVIDTVGGERLWDLIEHSGSGADALFAPGDGDGSALQFERINWPKIMSPWEMRCHIDYLKDWTDPSLELDAVVRRLDRLVMAWTGAWARFGTSDEGLPTYRALIDEARRGLAVAGGGEVRMRNRWLLAKALDAFIFGNAVARPQIAAAIGEDAA